MSEVVSRLESLGASLRRLGPESMQIYFNVLVEEMMNAPLPERLAQMESYKGASTRVKKVIEKKIIDELEKEAQDG